MSAPDIIEEAFERGRRLERLRCAKIVCPDCAKGLAPDNNGEHILEIIQGYAAHTRACLAHSILHDLSE